MVSWRVRRMITAGLFLGFAGVALPWTPAHGAPPPTPRTRVQRPGLDWAPTRPPILKRVEPPPFDRMPIVRTPSDPTQVDHMPVAPAPSDPNQVDHMPIWPGPNWVQPRAIQPLANPFARRPYVAPPRQR